MGANPRLAGGSYRRQLDLSFLDWKLPRAVPVLRAHAPPAGRRVARPGRLPCARTIARSGPHLLPALHGARPDHRLPGRQPHHGRRLSLQRGHGTAGHAGRLRGHRHRKRRALPLAAAQGGRVRAAEGVQREHRRIHQRGHSGGRPGRPRGKLEHADRAVQRRRARDRALGRKLSELFPADLCEQFDRVRGETGIHHIYKFVLQARGAVRAGRPRPRQRQRQWQASTVAGRRSAKPR